MSQQRSAAMQAAGKPSSDQRSPFLTLWRRRPQEAYRKMALIWSSLFRAKPRSSTRLGGGFVPLRRTVSAQRFSAEWLVPWIARGIPAEGRSSAITGLDSTALGVSLVELADPYQSVNRSLKYILLFLGLLFLSYFIFEVTTGKRVHPAQYILVGIAQIIFYLLLLSLAERIGFDFAFRLAGGATVMLLSANAGWIFQSRIQGLRALFCFGLLYALIYMLLRLEDNALLVGAIASFLAVASAMFFTREVDWYSQHAVHGVQQQQSTPFVAEDPA